jgi:hypothetical protein
VFDGLEQRVMSDMHDDRQEVKRFCFAMPNRWTRNNTPDRSLYAGTTAHYIRMAECKDSRALSAWCQACWISAAIPQHLLAMSGLDVQGDKATSVAASHSRRVSDHSDRLIIWGEIAGTSW